LIFCPHLFDPLQIELTDGGVELSVVNHLQKVVAQLGATCCD
jgi:hypothetical protein